MGRHMSVWGEADCLPEMWMRPPTADAWARTESRFRLQPCGAQPDEHET